MSTTTKPKKTKTLYKDVREIEANVDYAHILIDKGWSEKKPTKRQPKSAE